MFHLPGPGSRCIAFVALAWMVSPIPGSAQDDIELGAMAGEVRWSGINTVTSAHLTGNSVVAAPADPVTGSTDTVGAYPVGQFFPVARATYTPVNDQPAADTYRAATYQIAAPVNAAGSDFLLEVDAIALQNGASYRFGSRRPGSAWAQACSGVLPVADQPGGVVCNLSECPAVVDLQLRLIGTSADLDDLQDPIVCAAAIGAEEIPGSASYDLQARSAPALLAKALLAGPGASLSVLVRAGSALQVSVGCAATLADGAGGFPLDPQTGQAIFAAVAAIPAVGCGTETPAGIDVPVMRNAGDLTGLFDLAGYDEQSAHVQVRPAPAGGFLPGVNPPTFAASDQPDRNQSADFWTIEGLTEGNWEVEARALVAGGDWLMRLPMLGAANGVAAISAGEVTDLDVTFVTRPRKAEGRIVIADPGGHTDLDQLRNQPITSHWINHLSTSAMEAIGDASAAAVPNGGSGYRAISFGRLLGDYDEQQQRAELDYSVLMAGLSPLQGATDGSDARVTPWDVANLRLELGDNAAYRHTAWVDWRQDLHYLVEPHAFDHPPFSVPQQNVCIGQINAEFRVGAGDGALYAPRLGVPDFAGITAPTAVPQVTYRARGEATGMPRTFAQRSAQARVRLALPEGIRYSVVPQVRFVDSSGALDSELTLETRPLPPISEMACGAVSDVCLNIDAGSGTSHALGIGFDPPPPACLPAGQPVTLYVHVESDGLPVTATTYSLDGGPPQLLCGPCSADPSNLPIPLPALSAGYHTLVVEAGSGNGCNARLTHSLGIADGPLVLSCPQQIEVVLEAGEQSVAATDPRIAEVLTASATGACNLPVPIHDDRPDVFTQAQTDVVFTAADATCATTVSLIADRAQIALLDGNDVRVHRLDGQLEWQRTFSGPRDLAYDAAGDTLAVLDAAGVTVLDANDGHDLLSFPSFANPFRRVAFRPGSGNDLAFVVQGTNLQRNGPYLVWARLQGSSQPLQSIPIQLPQGWTLTAPSIAWSPDGTRILAALDAVYSAPLVSQNEHRLFVYEWDVTDGVLGSPETTLNWTRDHREIVLDIAYVSAQVRLLATSRGLFRITGNALLQPIASSEVSGLTLAAIGPEPATAVFGGATPHLALVSDAGVTHAPDSEGKGTAVAFSVNPYRRAAVGLPGVGFRLYRIAVAQSGIALQEDAVIPAADPGPAVKFRPAAP